MLRSLSLSVTKTLETSCVLFRSFQEINKFLGNCELTREMHMPETACFLLKHNKNKNALVTPNDSVDSEGRETVGAI